MKTPSLPLVLAALAATKSNSTTSSSANSTTSISSSSKSNSTSTASSSNTTCATGIHLIVARASTEKSGQGIIGAVATKVQNMLPGSDSEAVDYPATLTEYAISEASGVAAMMGLVKSYVARCPQGKIGLLGYSQGAQVVGDVMCGTSENFFNTTKALTTAESKNIVAVIQMGDPSHVPNLPQDVGNSTKPGIFPRVNTTSTCPQLATIAQSYCNADDRFCDSGNSTAVHLAYVQQFGTVAAQYIVSKMGGSSTSSSSNSSTGSNSAGAGAGGSSTTSTGTSSSNSSASSGTNSSASTSSANSSASTSVKSGAAELISPFSSIVMLLPAVVLGLYILS